MARAILGEKAGEGVHDLLVAIPVYGVMGMVCKECGGMLTWSSPGHGRLPGEASICQLRDKATLKTILLLQICSF